MLYEKLSEKRKALIDKDFFLCVDMNGNVCHTLYGKVSDEKLHGYFSFHNV